MKNLIIEFNKYTEEAEKMAKDKIKKIKFPHWIDACIALNEIVNSKQMEYIKSLNMIRIETVSGSEIYINPNGNIMIYGYPGKGKYTIGYLFNGVILGDKEVIITLAGVTDLEATDKRYITPTFLKKDLIQDNENRKVIKKIFKNKLTDSIKLIYKDWFDRKAKYHKFYTKEEAERFIEHNKIEVIGMA
jgi:hypothetical protein